MAAPSPKEITQLLLNWRNGDQEALNKLMPLVYDELHRLAEEYMRRERPDHTLQPTALVHEAYLRLVGKEHPQWQNRIHFFAVAAQLMRRILVDHARRHHSAKRPGHQGKISLDEKVIRVQQPHWEPREVDLIALDNALTNLASFDPRKCQIVELRFFGGLSIEETAQALDVSPTMIIREWRMAKAWIYGELKKGA